MDTLCSMNDAYSSIQACLFDNVMGSPEARVRAGLTKTEKQADTIERRSCPYTWFREPEWTIDLRLNAHKRQENEDQQEPPVSGASDPRVAQPMVSPPIRAKVA